MRGTKVKRINKMYALLKAQGRLPLWKSPEGGLLPLPMRVFRKEFHRRQMEARS